MEMLSAFSITLASMIESSIAVRIVSAGGRAIRHVGDIARAVTPSALMAKPVEARAVLTVRAPLGQEGLYAPLEAFSGNVQAIDDSVPFRFGKGSGFHLFSFVLFRIGYNSSRVTPHEGMERRRATVVPGCLLSAAAL